MARTIGIRHRVKATAEGEARPTQVVVLDQAGKETATYNLADEQAELDFLLGNYPVLYRVVESDENLETLPDRLLKHRKVKEGEGNAVGLVYRVVDGEQRIVTHVASEFDGLSTGDRVAMVLGGSGDYFAFALARKSEELGASVYRIPSSRLKELRGEAKKDDDATLLATSLLRHQELFYEFRTRDAELIAIREAYFARIDAMKARIACEQRLRQVLIGKIFCNPLGQFPEGAIEKLYDEEKANNATYQALLKEERKRATELQKLVEGSEVWSFLGEVEGLGWAIVSRILSSVVDIRRFLSKEAFKAFAGVHVLKDNTFVRRKRGVVANWQPDFRQALYLLGEQMNKRPESYWGQKLRENKRLLRERHPEVVEVEGKKRYTNGHIHKMATWRTLTQFAMWLYREWKHFDKDPENFKLIVEYPKPLSAPLEQAA